MIIIPAIDLLDGKCVRLFQGKFDQRQIFSDDPLAMAQRFAQAGAKYLHVVDLNGAKRGCLQQIDIIENIVRETGLKVQVGGGIRTIEQIQQLLTIGVERLVIGSKAVTAMDEVKAWLKKFGNEKIVLAFDIVYQTNAPKVKIKGWQQQSALTLWELLLAYPDLKHLLCTDILRDGGLTGPNVALYYEIKQRFPHLALQASGGVANNQDLVELAKYKIDSVVVGKALYTGSVNLSNFLEIIC